MSSHGFGFGPNNSDDDNNDDRNNPNGGNSGQGGQGGFGGFGDFGFFGFPIGGFGMPGPQGAQGANAGQGEDAGPNGPGGMPNLGDLLNQFGQMFSGLGQQFNSAGDGPVNYDAAERVARTKIGNVSPIRDSARQALSDALRLAELWLDDVTILPAGANRVEAWNSLQWLEHTMPTWKRIVEPVASQMNSAATAGLPEEAREMMGPMLSIMNQVNSISFGNQLGSALAETAKSSLTGSDLGLPLHVTGGAVLLPTHLTAMAEDLEVPARELLIYAAAREAAHQRLYDRVPWLAERMISSVEEYAAGLTIDYSAIEEAASGLNLENLQDPAQIQEAMNQMQGMDLSPKLSSSNEHARSRFQTLLALVEGWVDLVVNEALQDRLPGVVQLDEMWRRRRATDGVEQALEKATGIDFGAPKVREAVDLWRRLTVAVGAERRDQVWDHPDFLPVAEDLEDSAAFIDSVLGGSESDDFDPIAELEEQLRREAEQASAAGGSDGDSNTGTTDGNSGNTDDDDDSGDLGDDGLARS